LVPIDLINRDTNAILYNIQQALEKVRDDD
jgi:hypothetical protein